MRKPARHIVASLVAILTTITLARQNAYPIDVAIGVTVNLGIVYALAALISTLTSTGRKNSIPRQASTTSPPPPPSTNQQYSRSEIRKLTKMKIENPGWYRDPSDPNLMQYFDGTDWTDVRYFDGQNWVRKLQNQGSNSAGTISSDNLPPPHNLDNSSNKLATSSEQDIKTLSDHSAFEMPATLVSDLQALADLYERDMLSSDEYSQAKRRLLNY
jgi:hypothetical protein